MNAPIAQQAQPMTQQAQQAQQAQQPAAQQSTEILDGIIHEMTINYLDQFHEEQSPTDIYRKIIDEIERTLFSSTMKYTFGNQSKAAVYLGINRATLRTKLKRHGLM